MPNEAAHPGSTGNVIAALCSFFLPGLGQLVQGRVLAAFLYFASTGLFYGLAALGSFLVVPLVFYIPAFGLHAISVVSAATWQPR